MEFFTATCLNWQPLLQVDIHKNIIIDSMRYLVSDKRVWIYGIVIIPNYIHLLWCKQEAWIGKNIQQMFLKDIAQQIKFNLIKNYPYELINYKSTQADREYQFWKR